jgi:ElaB/YqjD/DUF883 family membrane-anchored ribosome-binding protein
MVTNVETVVGDLQQVLGELEKLLAASTGEAKAHAEEAVTSWRQALSGASDRLGKLQEATRRQVADAARTASRTLRDNPWKSMAIVATAGVLLGLALGNQQPKE